MIAIAARLGLSLTGVLLLGGCFPSFEDRPWLVDETRILAVRGTPAEQRPSQPVVFEALVVTPGGEVSASSSMEWSYCVQPRTADERTGVSASCAAGDNLEPIEEPSSVLSNACALFGPNPPPSQGDEPPRRPSDPDPTGGYYLPVRAVVTGSGDDPVDNSDVASFGFQRVRCDLAGATRAIFEEYQARYAMNVNPAVGRLSSVHADGTSTALSSGEPITVEAGATLGIRVEPNVGDAEPYVVYIAEEGAIFDRVESLTVSWYVTGGELERGSQSRSGTDTLTFETEWRAPDVAGAVYGWVVIRDSRGGSAWTSFELSVL